MEHADNADRDYWRRLLHRWFVQYNPLYLVSAALCIAGLRLLSQGNAEHGSMIGDLGIAGITEIYAFALIGGAALLTRLGQRRPAVIVALLAALYQGDLSLHTEGCIFFGATGIVAAAVWVAIFVAKLHALAWAVKVRLSRSAIGLASYAALGLAVIPQVIHRMNGGPRSGLVALWVFSVFALGLHVTRSVVSLVDLDDWGRTVLRRSLRAIWLLWALGLVLHVVFWSVHLSVSLGALVPAAVLLGMRVLRGEARVWAVVTGTLVGVAVVAPQLFSLCALMAAATLALRARQHLQETAALPNAPAVSPFRAENGDVAAPRSTRAWVIAPAAPAVQRRLLVGALFASYLAVWTAGWSGGPWPSHILGLDVLLAATVLFLLARMRVRIALPPLAASFAHLLVQVHVVPVPRTTLAWGALSTGGAFVLLLATLATSYWLRDVQTTESG